MDNSRRKYRVKNTQFECSKKKKIMENYKKIYIKKSKNFFLNSFLVRSNTKIDLYIYIYIIVWLSLTPVVGLWQTKCSLIWKVLSISDIAII